MASNGDAAVRRDQTRTFSSLPIRPQARFTRVGRTATSISSIKQRLGTSVRHFSTIPSTSSGWMNAVHLPALNVEPRTEREIIEAALAETRGRVSGMYGAAAKLRVPPSTLETRIKALKINKQ